MVSVDLRRALKTMTGVFVLLALGLPSTTFSQRGAQRQIAGNLLDEIRAAELRDGPNSAALIDPLTALGQLYENSGEPLLAAAAFRRAVEVVRVNYGLHSLEQAPLTRRVIEDAEAAGDHELAWDLEQELLTLAERHPDDLRVARILRETADRRMDILARYNAGEFPPEIVLGCYYGGGRCNAGSSHSVKQRLVFEAQTYYGQAVNIILHNKRYSSDELPPLLMELADTSYRYGNVSLGRRSLSYLLAYQTMNSRDWLTRIDALVQIADWDLLHAVGRDAADAALAEYAQAYELLERNGTAQESIDQMFSAETPVFLPAFLPHPLATEETHEAVGHIDVAFDIDRYGRSRHVRVLDTSDNSTRLAEKRLVQLISRGRFRPRFEHGHVVDAAPMAVRYSFDNVGTTGSDDWSLYWAPEEALRWPHAVGVARGP
jgi:hypothetical protein